jgi:hypothetical protein
LLTLSGAPDAPRLQDIADAILYLGKTDRLTRIQPSALVFRDEQFWRELNMRWKLVYGSTFNLANAGFDLRGPYFWPPPQIHFPSVSGLKAEDPVNFVFEKLKDYPLVGIGDMHMCLEYFQFIKRLIHDPRLPGKVQDIVFEFGNPRYQSVVDRYVFDVKSVPFIQRKKVWQYAVMGRYVANSPIYEDFYDELRSVNARLPRNKRIRVILGDAPFDITRFRADPDRTLRPFLIHKETAKDPREISIAASLIRVLAAGHRAIVLSGNGHLDLTQRTGNARHLLERVYPNKFFLIDENGPGAPSWPVPSIVTRTRDPEPNYATLWLGRPDRLTILRPSPLIYRDAKYWVYINLMTEVESHTAVDLASPGLEYRSRLFASDRGSN